MRNLLNFLLKYNHWFLLLLLELVCFTMLFRFNHYQGSAFFTSSNRLAGGVYRTASRVTSYFQLKEINERLVQHNVELEMQLEQMGHALRQLTADTAVMQRLKHDALANYQMIDARVIDNSLTHADNYITIDKGEEHGVRPEMGVVSGNGVVGVVYLTSARYSVVIPVLNSKSSISCKIKQSDYFGFLKWDGGSSRYAVVKDMPRHSLFTLGDTIVTSGHSAIFPGGIPVGTVEDMTDSHDGLSYLLKVKLFTDFARLDDVRVIRFKDREELDKLKEELIENRK